MSEPTQAPPIIQFGSYTLDVLAEELHKNGTRIRLAGQPLKVLLLLLQRPGKVVKREELRQRLWPSDTFVDFESGLNNAVKKLRDVLSDSAETPRFVETLPRRGYRFICPLNGAAAHTPSSATWWRDHWRTAAVFGMLSACLSGLLTLNVTGVRERLFGMRGDFPIRSLAVLPLENLIGDTQQEYFVDGIHDELITEVAQIGSLRVISRTSVLRYKQQLKSLPEIARELDVDGVLEGAVQRSGDRIHLTVQLISARNDRHVWAQSYDRDLRELPALPGEIALTIAGQLKIHLTQREQDRLAGVKTVDPDVYKAYLKGRYYAGKWTNKDLWQAIRHFQEALDLDPTYAPAWAGIGACYEYLGSFASGADLSSADARIRAKAALARAVELDPTLREPHQALGRMKLADWDWEGGAREFQRAKDLDPTWQGGTVYLLKTGRFDEAAAAQRWETEIDPLGYDTQLVLGWTYFMAGRFDESIAQLKKVIQLDPGIHHAHYELAWNYAKKGMYEEATAQCETALAIVRKRQPEAFAAQGCGWVYAMAGRRREALEIAHNLEKQLAGDDTSIQLAHIYDALGDYNRALAFLSKAYEERADHLPNQWYTPMISDRLRAAPRFQELIRRTGIPWATFPPAAPSVASATTKSGERSQP